jgi:hypothetical protein
MGASETVAEKPEVKRLVHDVFVTALEGGINYWSDCDEYHWSRRDANGERVEDLDGFYAMIREEGSDGSLRVDRHVIERGLRLAVTPEIAEKVFDYALQDVAVAFMTGNKGLLDNLDFDAGTADCVVQLGLFGEVIYG